MFLFLPPLTFFGLPLFLFLFLCLSVVLFLFFLPSCLSFWLSFCFLFLSLSFLFFLHCLCFMKRKNMKNIQLQLFFLEYFLFLLVSCLAFLFQIPFSYLCFFLILSYVFLFNINVFLVSKRTNWKAQKNKKTQLQTKTGFFMNLCFAKCQKLSSFFASFFAKFWLMFKKTL